MLWELLGQSVLLINFDICSVLNCYPAVIFHALNVKWNILFTWKKKGYIKYVLVLEFYITITTNNYWFMVLIKWLPCVFTDLKVKSLWISVISHIVLYCSTLPCLFTCYKIPGKPHLSFAVWKNLFHSIGCDAIAHAKDEGCPQLEVSVLLGSTV